MLGIFLISLASAEDESWGYVKAGDCISLTQTCGNCTFVNITGITYPNKTDSGLSEPITMQKIGTFFNHSFCETSSLGEYIVSGDHNLDGEIGSWNANFESTKNGKASPEGIVIIFFSILFIIIVIGMLSLLMNSIFHFISIDFDARDLTYNISAYFGLWVIYILGIEYLENAFVNDFLLFLIQMGSVTTVILPIIMFAVTFIKSNMKKGDHN